MSCWVAPAIAAEIWGVPVSQVWESIRSGRVPSKVELGFTVVDVAPDSAAAAPTPCRPCEDGPRPSTYTAVEPAPATTADTADSTAGEALPECPVEEGPFDWRPARARTALLRRRPELASTAPAAAA